MQISQPNPSAAKYQVLIATASEATLRLLQPLQHVTQSEGVAESGGLFRPQQRLVFQALDYQVVDTVVRSRLGDRPIATVIVDLQPGTESKAEQILNALYYAEPTIGIIVLLADGASLSKPLLDLITHSPRLTFLQMPASLAQVYQTMKLMLAVWQSGQKVAEMEAAKARPEAAPNTAPVPDVGIEGGSSMHLEVVGSLAAGISHEFNNVLTVIQSQMDMAMQQAGDLPAVVDLLTQVMETARNASALSKKLVSFTPEEESAPVALDLALAVDDEVMLLSKTLGEHIALEVNHAAVLPPVWASPAEVSQLIINVALHARNLMPNGGVLQLSTSKVQHQTGSKYARLFPDAKHGEYVMLTIEDPNPADETVAGPDPRRVVVELPSTVQRAADNRLAWIQRTLQAAGGALNVTLLPGMIRSYQMIFPLAQSQKETLAVPELVVPVLAPAEPLPAVQPSTVLVVDDDDTICMIMSQVLATEKHRVLVAKSADEAWQQWCQYRSSIKLLITDINMPGGANGVALGHAIQEQDGSVPVIYTSGHRAVHQFAELEIGTNYLPKPFGMNDLLAVANRALASHGHHGLS
ncbi:hypothetical protein GCM10023213_45620 [Prosthecobacter algae]|uniref:histidine kinase n=1 Tax=Prosthecobacter algae TaxID=1144682 RepID=A0ABP9PM28_9BACT